MVASGVVWCYKDDQWVPLQLSSIRLHGVLTQAHWVAVSEFLKRVTNKQLILEENGFKELTEDQKEELLEHQKKLEWRSSEVRADDAAAATTVAVEDATRPGELKQQQWQDLIIQENGLVQIMNGKSELDVKHGGALDKIPEQEVVPDANSQVLTFKFEPDEKRVACGHSLAVDVHRDLFIKDLTEETDSKLKIFEENKTARKSSTHSDEIALRLLRKYCKYNRDGLDDEILSAIDVSEGGTVCEEDAKKSAPSRTRKLSYLPKNDKLYENCVNDERRFSLGGETVENERNEHLLRWLKQQNRHEFPGNRRSSLPSFSAERRHGLCEKSPTDSRKSSTTVRSDGKSSLFSSSSGFESRKSSVVSTTDSRKSDSSSSSVSNVKTRKCSVTSNSSSEGEDAGAAPSPPHWHRFLKKHLESKKMEKRIKKQREAWARNTRKLSSGSESYSDVASQA